jgi:hypothetical protein
VCAQLMGAEVAMGVTLVILLRSAPLHVASCNCGPDQNTKAVDPGQPMQADSCSHCSSHYFA